jgi:hypothetical protein
MKHLATATEDEMIAAFLLAEVDSSRFRDITQYCMNQCRCDRRTIEDPDLSNSKENAIRKAVLSCSRGYRDQLLFTGFPVDVVWRKVKLELLDLATLRYANTSMIDNVLKDLSGGTFLVANAAQRFKTDPSVAGIMPVGSVLEQLCAGRQFAPLIAAEGPRGLTLIEGHTRATAYVVAKYAGAIEALIGSSPTMMKWQFY